MARLNTARRRPRLLGKVRVSAAAAAQLVLQPVVWPQAGGPAQLVAGAIEAGQAADEGVDGAQVITKRLTFLRGLPLRLEVIYYANFSSAEVPPPLYHPTPSK
jgi:hypothetical protein